jgi:hypothetical protein
MWLVNEVYQYQMQVTTMIVVVVLKHSQVRNQVVVVLVVLMVLMDVFDSLEFDFHLLSIHD